MMRLFVLALAIGVCAGIHSGLFHHGYSDGGVVPQVKLISDENTTDDNTLSYTTIQSIFEHEHPLENPVHTITKTGTKLISKRSLDNATRPKNPAITFQYGDENEHINRSESDNLKLKVRLLCMVMTNPKNHHYQAAYIKATWGKRCNELIFMSAENVSSSSSTESRCFFFSFITELCTSVISEMKNHLLSGEELLDTGFFCNDLSFPAVNISVNSEEYKRSWGKTKAAFRYVYDNHYYRHNHADWFLKVYDDTYVVVDNLRFLLANHDPRTSLYFGCRFIARPHSNRQGYMSGAAGYVLSRAALYRLVHMALPEPHLCKKGDEGFEDIEMGKCLEAVGVKAMDSRDHLHRGRFFPFSIEEHLFPERNKNSWYKSYQYYPSTEGLDSMSPYVISFHSRSPELLFYYDYLIYQLEPYGIYQRPQRMFRYNWKEYHSN